MAVKTGSLNPSKIIGTFKGKCCDAEVYNNNGMLLNRELFNTLINSEDYKRAMKYRHYIGFLGHPEDPNCMDFEHACIIMTSMEMLENGEIWGTFDLIDTPVGRIVKAFIDAGVIFGISIRGAGDIDGTGKVDPQTFVFRGYDLVTFPAYDDAIPEFHEIAASTDIQKQLTYKKVCNAIKSNLSKIQSCETLEIIQSQFDESSDEFQMIEDRIQQLDQFVPTKEYLSLLEQKLDAMTQLYLQQIQNTQKLFEENNELRLAQSKLTAASYKKMKTVERIMGAQMNDLENSLQSIENKYLTVVSANSKLKSQNQEYVSACNDLENRLHSAQEEVRSLKKENRRLQDVSSSSRIQASRDMKKSEAELDEKEREIQDLKSELDKVKGSNLIYKRKLDSATQRVKDYEKIIAEHETTIENSERIITEKDHLISEKDEILASNESTIAKNEKTIDGLRSKLSETVTANQKLDQHSSNRDAKISSLEKEVSALQQRVIECQSIVEDYQQAYADMCASAVGVDVENIPITSNTSPEQLRNYIFGSTATSNILTRPSFVEPEQIERIDDFYEDDGKLVSL